MKSYLQYLVCIRAKSFDEALTKAERLVELGGFGHTSVLYTNTMTAKDRIEKFGATMKTGRTIINMPAAQGAIGDLYNFKLAPSLNTRLWIMGWKLCIRERWS